MSDAKPCIVCGRALSNVWEDADNQPSNGTAFITHGHYGSTAYDPLDGSSLEINVCDPCLRAAMLKGATVERPPTKEAR